MRTRRYWLTGHLERDDRYVYAICDEALLAVHAASEGDALGRIQEAAAVYLTTLRALGELKAAIRAGKVKVETVAAGAAPVRGAGVEREGSDFRLVVAVTE